MTPLPHKWAQNHYFVLFLFCILPEHQAGLSVGNVLVGPSQLMDSPLPSNLVATVTLDSFEDYIHPDVHNFNINENVRSIPTEDVIVPVVSNLLGDLINNFGWDHVTLVYFHKGVAEQVQRTYKPMCRIKKFSTTNSL